MSGNGMHVLDQLDDYRRGLLDADERLRMEQHLADCSDCATALREAEELGSLLRANLTSSPSDAYFAGLAARAKQRAGEKQFVASGGQVVAIQGQTRLTTVRRLWVWQAAAAILLVSFVSIYLLRNEDQSVRLSEAGARRESRVIAMDTAKKAPIAGSAVPGVAGPAPARNPAEPPEADRRLFKEAPATVSSPELAENVLARAKEDADKWHAEEKREITSAPVPDPTADLSAQRAAPAPAAQVPPEPALAATAGQATAVTPLPDTATAAATAVPPSGTAGRRVTSREHDPAVQSPQQRKAETADSSTPADFAVAQESGRNAGIAPPGAPAEAAPQPASGMAAATGGTGASAVAESQSRSARSSSAQSQASSDEPAPGSRYFTKPPESAQRLPTLSSDRFAFDDATTSSVARESGNTYLDAESARLRQDYVRAIQLYEATIAADVSSATAAQAQHRIADVYYENLKDRQKALAAYAACLRDPLRQHFEPEALRAIELRHEELKKAVP